MFPLNRRVGGRFFVACLPEAAVHGIVAAAHRDANLRLADGAGHGVVCSAAFATAAVDGVPGEGVVTVTLGKDWYRHEDHYAHRNADDRPYCSKKCYVVDM